MAVDFGNWLRRIWEAKEEDSLTSEDEEEVVIRDSRGLGNVVVFSAPQKYYVFLNSLWTCGLRCQVSDDACFTRARLVIFSHLINQSVIKSFFSILKSSSLITSLTWSSLGHSNQRIHNLGSLQVVIGQIDRCVWSNLRVGQPGRSPVVGKVKLQKSSLGHL